MAESKKTSMRIFNSIEDVYSALDDGVDISTKFPFSHPTKTNNKTINLSLGRIWWNLLLPSDFELVDEAVDQKKVSSTIQKIFEKLGPEEASKLITKIHQESYNIGTRCPPTFEIDALILPDKIKKDKEHLQKYGSDDPIEFNDEIKSISKELNSYADEKDYRFYNINNSGAKSAPVDGLLIGRGSVVDIEGNISKPLRNALNDGQSIDSYYKSASEARRGFYYKAAIAAKPGYLSRRLTMAMAHIIIDQNNKDCGTKKYFKLTVTPDLVNGLNYRYIMVNGRPKLITDAKSILGQTVNLRSPLYCKAEKGICPICYGDSFKNVGTDKIGVLAGTDINDIVLNLFMKMRHQSSIPNYTKINFIDDLQKANIYTPEFKKYFTVTENNISANTEVFITLDLNSYDDMTLIESVEYYLLPGILTVTLSENQEKQFVFPFRYQVKLYKPNNVQFSGKLVTLIYSPGEKIITQEYIDKKPDVGVLENILEGQIKYINDPETMVYSIRDYISNLDMNQIELIVQNMFRDASDESKPARLTDYSNYHIIGQKKLPFVTSWVNAMAFENIGKAIKVGLVTGQDAPDDPITKIINEKYTE